MGKVFVYPMVILLLLAESPCTAQSGSSITNPVIELRDNQIHITYDILNSDSADFYNVRLEITDSAGHVIDAKTLSGDIGEQVNGGNDKQIIWGFQSDNVNIEGDLYIQIYAVVDRKEFTRTSLVLQSLAFPGLGLSRLDGRPHWIRGVAGYGCIAGSVVLNRMAISTYDDYQSPGSAENAGDLLEKATRQDNISEVLAFAAVGIWITDMVWTLIGTSGMNDQGRSSQREGITVHPGYDPDLQMPLLSLRYRF